MLIYYTRVLLPPRLTIDIPETQLRARVASTVGSPDSWLGETNGWPIGLPGAPDMLDVPIGHQPGAAQTPDSRRPAWRGPLDLMAQSHALVRMKPIDDHVEIGLIATHIRCQYRTPANQPARGWRGPPATAIRFSGYPVIPICYIAFRPEQLFCPDANVRNVHELRNRR